MANTILLRYSTAIYLGDPSTDNLIGAKHGNKLVLPQSTKAKVQSLAVLLVFWDNLKASSLGKPLKLFFPSLMSYSIKF